jgi:microcystin-dependent protein
VLTIVEGWGAVADFYLGEVRLFTFGFAPRGWAQCNGQLLPINTNQALFALLGTTYGGNGQTNFALPDLRGRAAIGFGGALGLLEGARFGTEVHPLSLSEIPSHTHLVSGSTQPANSTDPSGRIPALAATSPYRLNAVSTVPMSQSMDGVTGGAEAHDNRQPLLAMNFCIALQGIFPPRS